MSPTWFIVARDQEAALDGSHQMVALGGRGSSSMDLAKGWWGGRWVWVKAALSRAVAALLVALGRGRALQGQRRSKLPPWRPPRDRELRRRWGRCGPRRHCSGGAGIAVAGRGGRRATAPLVGEVTGTAPWLDGEDQGRLLRAVDIIVAG